LADIEQDSKESGVEIIRSRSSVPIRLTEERWAHISENHPELALMRAAVLETVTDPDLIQAGDSGEFLAIRRYDTPLSSKYLVVPYREVTSQDGFILTAYLTSRMSTTREILWKR
jgi:hypothetical protein